MTYIFKKLQPLENWMQVEFKPQLECMTIDFINIFV